MAIGDSAGLLFRIKADGDQAKRELNSVKSEIGGLGGAINALGGPAGIATAALTAIGTAAVAAVAGITRLTIATANYGSELYDASIQTGLSAASISALKLAADTSGSSLEAASGSVSKLNVVLGQAASGNEKAQATLEKYGITATDTNEAFAQAVKVIGEMTDQGDKASAMMALFKDRTGQMGGIIDAVKGDFQAFTEEARKLGLVLSEEDLKAADDFGDTLDILGKQAAAAGQRFALELMPNATHAMQAISGEMEGNHDVAQSWGRALGDIIRGLEIAFSDLRFAGETAMEGLNYALGTNLRVTVDWAHMILATLGPIGATFAMLRKLGQSDPLATTAGAKIGGQALPDYRMPSLGGGGARGGGGRGGGGGSAPRDTEFQDAEKRQMRLLEEYRNGLKAQKAELDLHLAAKIITEREYAEEIGKLKIRELKEEKLTYETIQKFAKITADKKEELEHKIGIVQGELHTQQIENSKEILEIDLDAIEKTREAEEKLDAERKKIHEAYLKRQHELANERRRRANQAAVDEDRKEQARLANKRINSQRLDGGGTEWEELFTFLQDSQQFRDNNALIAGIEVMRSAFEGLAQAIGQVVNAWVLYGSAGTTFRKVTAQILAGIAQQAAVKAIFELAEGFAALARAFFGDPKASAEAAMHFKSAAIYGTVAGVAAIAGRGVAGNTFNEATGGGGGGAGGGNSSDNERRNFSEPFRGFGDANNPFMRPIVTALDRVTQAVMLHEEATNRFTHQFGPVTPGDVVMRVAESDPDIFGRANEKYLDESGGRGTERLMRRTGMAT